VFFFDILTLCRTQFSLRARVCPQRLRFLASGLRVCPGPLLSPAFAPCKRKPLASFNRFVGSPVGVYFSTLFFSVSIETRGIKIFRIPPFLVAGGFPHSPLLSNRRLLSAFLEQHLLPGCFFVLAFVGSTRAPSPFKPTLVLPEANLFLSPVKMSFSALHPLWTLLRTQTLSSK